MTPETHDHATTCEITMGRGCDCGLTGMAGVEFYMKGEAVYKKPVERGALMNPPAAFDVEARRLKPSSTEWLRRRLRPACGDAELQQEGERHLAMLQKYEEVYSEVNEKVSAGLLEFFKSPEVAQQFANVAASLSRTMEQLKNVPQTAVLRTATETNRVIDLDIRKMDAAQLLAELKRQNEQE